jgi:hypothetical protein
LHYSYVAWNFITSYAAKLDRIQRQFFVIIVFPVTYTTRTAMGMFQMTLNYTPLVLGGFS